jgi:acetoin utilization deacetylase AcuC-like enzyme
MKVVFHEDFYQVYTSDPAAAAGRMESIMNVIEAEVEVVTAAPASEEDILDIHTKGQLESVKRQGLFPIASLAAGGAVQAAKIGLSEPAFAAIRPPGHHASADSCWGFCYFNNMAVALSVLKKDQLIKSAYVLDFDLHYGDGNVNILEKKDGITVYNVDAHDREDYLRRVQREMNTCEADIIGISAGFDNHVDDWGGTLLTEDYYHMGQMVVQASRRIGGGCFAILEGGYNHSVLGYNVQALIKGMAKG